MSEKVKFGSDEWIKQLMVELNNSESYAEAAKNWEGDICFVIDPKGSSLDHEIYMYVDLWHGKCKSARILASKDELKPEFTIGGTVKAFREVIDDGLDPMKALLTRKLKLTGNMAKIMKNVKSANQLVLCCTYIPTNFPLEE